MSPDLLINLIGPQLSLPRLPATGLPLRQTFVSHLAVEGDDPEALIGLLRALLVQAAARGPRSATSTNCCSAWAPATPGSHREQ